MKYQEADELSRLPTGDIDRTALKDQIPRYDGNPNENHDEGNSVVSSRAQKKKRLPKHLDEHDLKLPSWFELFIDHSKGVFCERSFQLDGLPYSALTFKKTEFL